MIVDCRGFISSVTKYVGVNVGDCCPVFIVSSGCIFVIIGLIEGVVFVVVPSILKQPQKRNIKVNIIIIALKILLCSINHPIGFFLLGEYRGIIKTCELFCHCVMRNE